MIAAVIRSVRSSFQELGRRDGFLYLIDRALRTASGERARLVRYLLVAQPVPSVQRSRNNRAGRTSVREVHPTDPVVARFPRPAAVIARRFEQGARCYVAEVGDEFAGYLWLAHGGYEEDEVRCRYAFTDPATSVWDFDVYVVPEYRLGRTFARLWDAANHYLQECGVLWTFSRISAFNAASRSVHGRLGMRELHTITFLCLGRLEIRCSGAGGGFRCGVTRKSFPVIELSAPLPKGDEQRDRQA